MLYPTSTVLMHPYVDANVDLENTKSKHARVFPASRRALQIQVPRDNGRSYRYHV